MARTLTQIMMIIHQIVRNNREKKTMTPIGIQEIILQAGAELGQAQIQLELGLTLIKI